MNGEVKSSKSMPIKTGYPNSLHGCDFLCSCCQYIAGKYVHIFLKFKEFYDDIIIIIIIISIQNCNKIF